MSSTEVADLPDLFELMVGDARQAAPIFQPTNYWLPYVDTIERHIRTHGLRDFRRMAVDTFRPIGAGETLSYYAPEFAIKNSDLDDEIKAKLLFFIKAMVENPGSQILPYELSLARLQQVAYRLTDLYGSSCGARPLAGVEASLAGNPRETFEVDGRVYTYDFLCHYWRYAEACQHIDFDEIDSIVEIGAGLGAQVEVIRKLHPRIRFYVLDLPTTLYVCNRWLDAVFPGVVEDYRDVRGRKRIQGSRPGAILTLGNWQVDDIAPTGSTLLWNAASFGEMEPDVVRHYLHAVRPYARFVHLIQVMRGKYLATRDASGTSHGVIEQTTFTHYADGLGPEFALVERAPTQRPLGSISEAGGYERATWRRAAQPL